MDVVGGFAEVPGQDEGEDGGPAVGGHEGLGGLDGERRIVSLVVILRRGHNLGTQRYESANSPSTLSRNAGSSTVRDSDWTTTTSSTGFGPRSLSTRQVFGPVRLDVPGEARLSRRRASEQPIDQDKRDQEHHHPRDDGQPGSAGADPGQRLGHGARAPILKNTRRRSLPALPSGHRGYSLRRRFSGSIPASTPVT